MVFLWLLEIICQVKQESSTLKSKEQKQEWEVEYRSEQEKQEIRDTYVAKGFKNELLETIVNVITAKRKYGLIL
jgi:hypothetical protein